MTAATTSAIQAAADIVSKKIEGSNANVTSELVSIKGSGQAYNWSDTFTLATTRLDDVGDITRLLRFPPGAVLDEFRGTISDADTNATPTLVYSILVTDSADATKTTVVLSSTNGQAGGTDRITNAAVGTFAGDYFLSIKIGTVAATPAAATYKVYVKFSIGTLSLLADVDPLMTTAGI